MAGPNRMAVPAKTLVVRKLGDLICPKLLGGIPQSPSKYAPGVNPHLRFNALGELDTGHD
ncbi:MAG: hypothetical protein CBB71_22105 [Rhodopirellula sp. TMED11]|nr:MAG: hypothetical protein CBB71_22105 [Rhodopirellula sp. TMED11]